MLADECDRSCRGPPKNRIHGKSGQAQFTVTSRGRLHSNWICLPFFRVQDFPFGIILEPIQARNGDYCSIAPRRPHPPRQIRGKHWVFSTQNMPRILSADWRPNDARPAPRQRRCSDTRAFAINQPFTRRLTSSDVRRVPDTNEVLCGVDDRCSCLLSLRYYFLLTSTQAVSPTAFLA